MSAQLILIRHGESQWNQENRFTGWVDVDLSEKGVGEAIMAGQLIGDYLRDSGIHLSCAFTSYLLRAAKTLWLTLEHSGQIHLPITPSWALNERHYGALTGLNKTETAQKYGDEQVKIWRRSYATRPPLMAEDDQDNPARAPRYSALSKVQIPMGESLADTEIRVREYFQSAIAPLVREGKNILIVAHGNSLRALIKHLDNLSESAVLELNIPTGVPMVYRLTGEGAGFRVEGKQELGSPEDIARRAKEVAAQGRTH